MKTYESRFKIKDKVIIDDDEDLVAIVTGLLFRENLTFVECSWMHSGSSYSSNIEEWRLTKCST